MPAEIDVWESYKRVRGSISQAERQLDSMLANVRHLPQRSVLVDDTLKEVEALLKQAGSKLFSLNNRLAPDERFKFPGL
jgi:uncharacterized protein HemX